MQFSLDSESERLIKVLFDWRFDDHADLWPTLLRIWRGWAMVGSHVSHCAVLNIPVIIQPWDSRLINDLCVIQNPSEPDLNSPNDL